MNRSGFSHSDTAGSMLRSSFPTTIVAMYVLLRYFIPRHPLSALVSDFFLVQWTRICDLSLRIIPRTGMFASCSVFKVQININQSLVKSDSPLFVSSETANHHVPNTNCGPYRIRQFVLQIGFSPMTTSPYLCGPSGGRTHYLYIANVAFSQLNFGPASQLIHLPLKLLFPPSNFLQNLRQL